MNIGEASKASKVSAKSRPPMRKSSSARITRLRRSVRGSGESTTDLLNRQLRTG